MAKKSSRGGKSAKKTMTKGALKKVRGGAGSSQIKSRFLKFD
jgi:hypothetical protein